MMPGARLAARAGGGREAVAVAAGHRAGRDARARAEGRAAAQGAASLHPPPRKWLRAPRAAEYLFG